MGTPQSDPLPGLTSTGISPAPPQDGADRGCRSELPEAAEPSAGAIALVVAMKQLVLGFGVSDAQHLVLVDGFVSLFEIGSGEASESDGGVDVDDAGLSGGGACGVHVGLHSVSPCLSAV
jgi:hypothetical protein